MFEVKLERIFFQVKYNLINKMSQGQVKIDIIIELN